MRISLPARGHAFFFNFIIWSSMSLHSRAPLDTLGAITRYIPTWQYTEIYSFSFQWRGFIQLWFLTLSAKQMYVHTEMPALALLLSAYSRTIEISLLHSRSLFNYIYRECVCVCIRKTGHSRDGFCLEREREREREKYFRFSLSLSHTHILSHTHTLSLTHTLSHTHTLTHTHTHSICRSHLLTILFCFSLRLQHPTSNSHLSKSCFYILAIFSPLFCAISRNVLFPHCFPGTFTGANTEGTIFEGAVMREVLSMTWKGYSSSYLLLTHVTPGYSYGYSCGYFTILRIELNSFIMSKI